MKLFKPIRDALFITFLVIFFYILFLILGILQQIDYTAFTNETNQVSGGAIRVGNQIVINGTTNEPKKQQAEPADTELSNNLRCWKKAGMTLQDFAIVGDLLQATMCEEQKGEKNVQTAVTADCLQISVGGELTTNVCYPSQEGVPSFAVVIQNAEGEEISLPDTKRNYLPAILFLCILFTVFGFWSWDELRSSFVKQDRFKPYDELELIYGSHRPPHYAAEKIASTQEDREYTDKLYQKLMREKERVTMSPPFSKKILSGKILIFNKLCDQFTAAIKRNDLVGVQKISDELFEVFFPLYRSVAPEHRNILLERILALNKQYNLLKKSTSIASLIQKTYDATEKEQAVYSQQTQKNDAEQNEVQELDQHIRKLQRTLRK